MVSSFHDTAWNIRYLPCMDVTRKIQTILDQLNTVMVGKPGQVQDGVACLLAGGHLLIEDVPGVGKTRRRWRTRWHAPSACSSRACSSRPI